MPTYDFQCQSCQNIFEKLLPLKESDTLPPCEICGKETKKLIVAPNISFPGDDWTSKNLRIKKQMQDRRDKTGKRERDIRESGIYSPKLVPNVDGQRVDSWKDAQKIAGEQGKNTASYDTLVRKESK